MPKCGSVAARLKEDDTPERGVPALERSGLPSLQRLPSSPILTSSSFPHPERPCSGRSADPRNMQESRGSGRQRAAEDGQQSGGDGESAAPQPAPSNDVLAVTPRPAPSKAFGLEIKAFGLEIKSRCLRTFSLFLKSEQENPVMGECFTSSRIMGCTLTETQPCGSLRTLETFDVM